MNDELSNDVTKELKALIDADSRRRVEGVEKDKRIKALVTDLRKLQALARAKILSMKEKGE